MTAVDGHTTTGPLGPRRHRSGDGVPLLLGFSELLAGRKDIVGARAARLSLAARSHLPVPDGSVLTPAALGWVDSDDHTTSATSDAIEEAFDDIGGGGRLPLMISASAASTTGHSADKIAPSCGVTVRSELLHAIRRLSVTASLLGDSIAVVIQRDLEAARTGRMIASRSNRRVVASITQQDRGTDSRRLIELAHRISDVFNGDRWVTWTVDRHGRLWIRDIGSRIGF